MTKHKKIIIATVSVLLCTLLLAVLFITLKKRVFPALNDYNWSYEQEFIDEHDSDMNIDGKLDEARWSGQKWLTHSDNGVTVKYTTVFTEYGLYVGAVADDDNLQWNKRFNFARYTDTASNSAFHFRISHSDETTATTFNCYNFYVDAKDSASRNQTHHEAKSSLNGELNSEDGQNKATQMTAELFVSWEALHIEDGKPDDIRIFPEYRYVEGESSTENTWIKPICYEEGTARMFLSALFDKDGYINADEENALLGDSKTGMSKSDGWDISKADKGQVSASDYYQQNIFFKDIYSDAYMYSTTVKITGEQEGEVGYAGVCDVKDGGNVHVFYIDAKSVLEGNETLTMYMLDYSRWEVTTIGTIPNKASYKTEGIPITVIKNNTHIYYLVDGSLVHCEEISYIEGQSSPGLFTLRASAEYEDCKVTDYADKKDELKDIISKYVYSVEIEGKISGGSVTTDVIALPKNGKVAGQDLNLSIVADNGYILTELTITGTNKKSDDYLAYAAKNMYYGSLVIPKESITGDVVISAKFSSVTKVFGNDAIAILTGTVTNAVGAKQSAKIVIHNQECLSPLLSSVTQSGVNGAFDVYLLKKGIYTIGNGVTIKSDGKYVLGASNSGYVTEYVNVTADSKEAVSIVLTKNKVTSGWAEPGDGTYKSTSASAHNYFVDGIGKTWTTNMTLPEMPDGQQVGYVLHMADSDVTWTQWMRIAAVVKDGTLKVLVHMNVDGEIYAQKYYDTGIDAAQAEGKVLHLLLEGGKLNCYVNNKVVFVFTDFSVINDYTVSQVLGLNNKVACGLYTNEVNVVLHKYSFTTENVPEGEVLYQVKGTVTADTDALRRFQIVATDTKNGDIYATDVDREGNYSIDLPKGQYRFTLKHSSQDKFFYPTPVEKNVITVNKNMDTVNFTAKTITANVGTFNCKLNIPLISVETDEFKLKLKHESYGEFTVYRNLDGSFTTNAPVGNYQLSVKHKTETLFKENVFNVTIKKGDNNKTVTLRKNAINNGAFTFTENRFFESVSGYLHNCFADGYGKVWMAELEMPELQENEEIGFVIHKYNDSGVVWGNWLRLIVAKGTDGKLVVGAQICADKTEDTPEINVGCSRVTDIDVASVAGKTLKAVFKDGILTLQLDGQILNVYTNDTYLASYGKSTQVKDVLDFNGQLTCGLLTNTKGMVIKDWAFTNVEKNVPANPVLNGTLKGKVQLSINTLGLDQVRLILHSKDGKMSFQTYANADGLYEIKAPVGEYRLEVANDGVAAYIPYEKDVVVRRWAFSKNIVLDENNAINNSAFVLNKEGYFESARGFGHNSFVNGYGNEWEANLTMPELQENEEVGFVIHRYGENDVVWENWLRLLVARGTDGKLIVGAQICADKTEDTPEINVGCSRVTDIDATSVAGKTLKAVFKDGILTFRLDGQILNLYTNDTYLASNDKSTQVKDVLDLNGKLACGLLTNTKGMIIKNWSFTNIKENVSDNPTLNGTLSGKVEHSLSTMGLDQVRLVLQSKNGKTSFQTYANADGIYEIKAPAGKYQLTVSNDGVAAYVLYEKEITLTKEGTTENIVLTKKNAINNGTFTLNEDGYFESTTGFGHNCFVRGYGDAWEANFTMPELQVNEEVGFVIHRYGENDVVWENWLRLLVARGTDGKLIVGAQICADKTEDTPEINVGCSRVTDIDATSVEGKTLKAVFKDGILTLRLDGQILNLYTNDTYLASNGKSTQVKDVLDLNDRLACGLLTSAKGIVIKDWSFTNIKADVSNNPKLNGTLSGNVKLNVNTLGLDQVRFVLQSEDGKTSFQTYANADGVYEVKAPVGKYMLEVSNDGLSTYIPYQAKVNVTEEGIVHDVVLDKKNAINNETFVLTEDGDYKSNSNAGHNFFVNGYGNAWTADFTMTELKEGEAAGFVLHKQKTDGSVDWDNWMRIYISKNADGTLDLGANMGDKGGYRLFRMSGNTVEGKVFRVTLSEGQLIISLDEKVLYKFKSDTELVSGKATVGEIIGLSNTSEIYCGLLAAPSGVVIKDWAFTNIPENLPSSPTYNGTLSGTVELSINTLGFDMVHLTLSNAEGTEKYSTYTLLDRTYEIKAPVGNYQLEVTNDDVAAYVPYKENVTVTEEGTIQNIVFNEKNLVNDNTFVVTEDGDYKCTALQHNYFVEGYGSAWMAEFTLTELNAGQAIGVVLHKQKADGSVNWDNWMRIYLEKDGSGNLWFGANKGDYKVIQLPTISLEGKVFRIMLLDGELIVTLDGDELGRFNKDTVLQDGKPTVGECLGLSKTGEVYCGLLGTPNVVIKDWSFTNIRENLPSNPTYNGTLKGKVQLSLNTLPYEQIKLTLTRDNGIQSYSAHALADGTYEIKAPAGTYQLEVTNDGVAAYVPYKAKVIVTEEGTVHNIVINKKNLINDDAFVVTEDGNYKCTALRHNYFVNGYGSAWMTEFTLTELNAGQAIGVVLHKQKADGSVNWDNWMRIYLEKDGSGNLWFGANKGDYKVTQLAATSLEGKVFRITLLNGELVVTLGGTELGRFNSDTVLQAGQPTVGECLGLSKTGEVYCGLLGTPDVVIKDWSFTNNVEILK